MDKKGKFINFKNIFSTILNIIFYTIFFLLVLIVCMIIFYFIISKIFTKKGEDTRPPFALYMIVSPSMEPNINVYDVVLDKKVNNINKLKVGDVITFKSNSIISNGLVVTHRINKIENNNGEIYFITKGDNNQNPDSGKVNNENIYGKVIMKIPQLGRLTTFLSNRGVWLIVIVLPSLAIIIYDIFKLIQLIKLKNKVDDIEEPTDDLHEEIQDNYEEQNISYDEKINLDTTNEDDNDELYLLDKKNEDDNIANKNDMFYIAQEKKDIPFDLPKLKDETESSKNDVPETKKEEKPKENKVKKTTKKSNTNTKSKTNSKSKTNTKTKKTNNKGKKSTNKSKK